MNKKIIFFFFATIFYCKLSKSLIQSNLVKQKSNRLDFYHSEAQIGEKSICEICDCEFFFAIKCYKYQDRRETMDRWRNTTLNRSHFLKFNKLIKIIFINSYNIELRIKYDTFDSMENLNYLTLDNIPQLTILPNLHQSNSIKEITVHNSQLKFISPDFCKLKDNLEKVDFSYNDLDDLKYVFDHCLRITLLDLSYNRIKSLAEVFNQELGLIDLNLSGNLLTSIGKDDFWFLKKLIELNLSRNRLTHIDQNAFDTIENLQKLDLSKNNLFSIPLHSKVYHTIKTFLLNDNQNLYYLPHARLFSSIHQLHLHYSYHCCPFLKKKPQIKTNSLHLQIDQPTEEFLKLLNNNYTIHAVRPTFELEEYKIVDSDKKITCVPLPDSFTPCENLLEDLWLRMAVWLVSILGIFSNISVVVYNTICGFQLYRCHNNQFIPTFLLSNLAIADSLMSLYLFLLALKDATSRHKFGQSALEWQTSFTCNFAGFLSTVSSVASAFCLSFITFDRYYAIRNSFDSKRIGLKTAIVWLALIWTSSICIALLPLFQVNSYSAYAICLPLQTKNTTHVIYIIFLNVLLIFCLLLISFLYGSIFVDTLNIERRSSFSSCSSELQLKIRFVQEKKLARNIFLLVMSNFFCWGPLVILSCYSLLTKQPINRDYFKILAVFIIPFNSLLNPFLYCFSRRTFRIFIKNEISRKKIFQLF
ncbi:lutropin-choriogonadotropic hormone receptor isoform X2 [Brachionus plicatilis]|uniref:Lutropin-choriogonadotropic hormone receptor isoform X2 n=1 Tax=Brachionus plicatilis TaxID=10195 RepID=A0A3M7Q397_BRAPC|nr:lutropin-choriogonadotropic hormone receptor isoform X2 [Brachionus plicatilis]